MIALFNLAWIDFVRGKVHRSKGRALFIVDLAKLNHLRKTCAVFYLIQTSIEHTVLI
jgi:hypothetical protein